jgi:hypothetical protein
MDYGLKVSEGMGLLGGYGLVFSFYFDIVSLK